MPATEKLLRIFMALFGFLIFLISFCMAFFLFLSPLGSLAGDGKGIGILLIYGCWAYALALSVFGLVSLVNGFRQYANIKLFIPSLALISLILLRISWTAFSQR